MLGIEPRVWNILIIPKRYLMILYCNVLYQVMFELWDKLHQVGGLDHFVESGHFQYIHSSVLFLDKQWPSGKKEIALLKNSYFTDVY